MLTSNWKLVCSVALLAVSCMDLTPVIAKSDSSTPGECEDSEDCEDGYQCVSLQTTRAGTETVSQCLPYNATDTNAVCSGTNWGLCPSFSSWKTPYDQINSVCTYFPATECVTGTETSNSGSSQTGVQCIGVNDGSGSTYTALYGCVDFDTSDSELLFGGSYTSASRSASETADQLADVLGSAQAIEEGCYPTNSSSGNSSSSGTSSTNLCSGHGTCYPTSTSGDEYACLCNVGYNGTYCSGVSSDECALPGQCLTGECDLESKTCKCEEGTTGNQCSECDPDSSKACNGNGKCSSSGKCTCDKGYTGTFCDGGKGASKKSGSTGDSQSASISTMSIFMGSMVVAVSALF